MYIPPPPPLGYTIVKGEFVKNDYENTFQNNFTKLQFEF